ncbi:hypothetical protein [Streptomyces sp. NBC_01320]|nr:hypothetical protein OG395_24385 [Streptomyces sp. NBC_01320]
MQNFGEHRREAERGGRLGARQLLRGEPGDPDDVPGRRAVELLRGTPG